jgi:outer membrane protein
MFKPYVGLGVNYTIFTKNSFHSDELGGAKVSVERDSVGLAAQIGADFLIDKNWSINVDAKYIKMETDAKINGTKIGKIGLDPFTYGVGVGYRF